MIRFHVGWGLAALLAFGAPGPGAGQVAEAGATPALHPGDILEVRIWRELELSGHFVVDEEGVVTLPMLGRIPVAGIPLGELRALLLERYAVELRNPSIEIRHLRRVHVLGEVRQPGLLELDPTVSLAGAVALAGGATPLGSLKRIRILRGGEVILENPGPEVDLLTIQVRSGDQIFVERRSWMDRNSPYLVSVMIGSLGLLLTLLR